MGMWIIWVGLDKMRFWGMKIFLKKNFNANSWETHDGSSKVDTLISLGMLLKEVKKFGLNYLFTGVLDSSTFHQPTVDPNRT